MLCRTDAENAGRIGGLLTGVRKTAPLFCYAYRGERGRDSAWKRAFLAGRDGAGRRVAWNGAGVRNNGAWTACRMERGWCEKQRRMDGVPHGTGLA